MIMNLHPLLDLWFERIPSVVQGTENVISNHPLFHCSIFNIELQKGDNDESVRHPGEELSRKTALRTLSGWTLAIALVYRILT
jgi:hypothetical protein